MRIFLVVGRDAIGHETETSKPAARPSVLELLCERVVANEADHARHSAKRSYVVATFAAPPSLKSSRANRTTAPALRAKCDRPADHKVSRASRRPPQ
jgi:hypothetical protein